MKKLSLVLNIKSNEHCSAYQHIYPNVFSSSSYYIISQIIKNKQGMWLCPRSSSKWRYYQWIKYIYIWYFADGRCRKTFPFVDTVLSGLSIGFHETAFFLQIQDIFEKLLIIIKKVYGISVRLIILSRVVDIITFLFHVTLAARLFWYNVKCIQFISFLIIGNFIF